MRDLRRSATWSGIFAILLWSSLALMAVFTASLPPFEVLAISFAIGGWPVLASPGSPRARLDRLLQPWPAFVLALAALFGYHALYFIAFRHAPAIEVNLINYLWPLLIVVFAAFLPGVRLRPGQLIGTLLGLGGVIIMLVQGRALAIDPAHLPGYAAAFAAALIWSGYSVLNRRHAGVPSAAIAGPCLLVALLAGVVHLLIEQTVVPDRAQTIVLVLMGLGPVGVSALDRGTSMATWPCLEPNMRHRCCRACSARQRSRRRNWARPWRWLLLLGAWISVRASRADAAT
jgi:drug/metabolite transporter (DMT)-like permease